MSLSGSRRDGLIDAIQRNPFIVPDDADVLQDRAREQLQRETLRASRAMLPAWDRVDHTASVLSRTRAMIADIQPATGAAADSKHAKAKRAMLAAAAAGLSRDRRSLREPLSEMIEKKRELFLVQTSLRVKQEEMAKMASTIAVRTQALHKAEEMLEEDAVHFDAFLQNNERAAQLAVRNAEAAARAKANEALELKRAKYEVGHAAVEVARAHAELEEFARLDAFLQSLTPEEWFTQALASQAALVKQRRASELERRQTEWRQMRIDMERDLTTRFDGERKAALRMGRAYARVDVMAAVNGSMPPFPKLEDVPIPVLSPEELEIPLYFTDPAQLGAVFASLEKSNLFLIQNCQDTEQVLEETNALAAETSAAMARQNASLEQAVAMLNAQISAEEAKAAALRQAAGRQEGGEDTGAGGAAALSAATTPAATASDEPGSSTVILDVLMPQVKERVVDIFTRAGFKATSSSDITSMLTALEARLEALLVSTSRLDPGYVSSKLKAQDRERRRIVREARQATAKAQHEARLAKMIARAQAPVVRLQGKPVMYRSLIPPVHETHHALVDPDEVVRQEEARFFSA